MNYLRERYDALPKEAKDDVFRLLYVALMHRGGGGLRQLAALGLFEDIAKAFACHGYEVEQLT